MEHTPGPWEYWAEKIPIEAHDDLQVFQIDSGRWIADVGPDCDPQRHANAHLIAAAPDLLAALRLVISTDPDPDPDGMFSPAYEGAIQQARAAIAKAKGTQKVE